MLTSPAGSRRDWGIFAAAALAPSIAMGVLALRAISNEDAGVRREAALALTAAAQEASRTIDRGVAEGARALEKTALDPIAAKAGEALRALAPAFAEPIVLAADRALLYPPPIGAEPSPPPASCAGLVAALSAPAGEGDRAEAKRTLLLRCAEARTPTGRWVWPLVSLDALGRGEADPAAVALWFEAHRGMLGEAERAATLLEVRSTPALSGPSRDRALAALGPSGSRREAIAAVLSRERVQAALRSAAERGDAQAVTFRAGGAVGSLRAQSDGRLAGFVIYAGSLTDALAGGALSLPAGVEARVIEGSSADRGGAASTEPLEPSMSARSASSEPLAATVAIAPSLALRIAPADPAALARRAARSRRILAAIGVGAMAAAFALASALFARMRAARRLSALRTDFVATVSHELRTPIASVRMMAELLDEGRVEPEEQREVIEALSREARRLGDTVERLLSFSRMEAGRAALRLALQPVASVVSASIDAFEEQSPGEPPVARDLDEGAEASIDAAQIRVAVDNLLANARKHAPRGAPYGVCVRRERGGVAIAVSDRGPGIKKRDQRRIFEPFERGDDRLSRATEGSGIGLSLVRHVARAHGGHVRVESEKGTGATFILWLPGRTA